MVECLDWDSDFFKLRIGKVVIASERERDTLKEISTSIKNSFDLVYVFSSPEVLVDFTNCSLVDQKVVYKKDVISPILLSDSRVLEYKEERVSEDLLGLALYSGVYSRFNLDKNLPEGSYERLYARWIEQSVNQQNATRVFCYMLDGNPRGLITISIKDQHGDIGLVSTHPLYRGRGIGSTMLKHVEHFCAHQGVKELFVPTQRRNLPACHLYEKAGFSEVSCTNVWHWWLR